MLEKKVFYSLLLLFTLLLFEGKIMLYEKLIIPALFYNIEAWSNIRPAEGQNGTIARQGTQRNNGTP